MSQYRLEISKTVRQQVDSLPGNYRQRIREIINTLAINPRPAAAEPLRTGKERYRIRIDMYRIAYQIFDDTLVVSVLKVGRKRGPEFYEELE